MKVKYLILVQCLLITFVLYMFKDLFIINLPAWLITLPVTAPLLIYIVIRYFKKRKEKRAYKPIIKTEEKALLWLANYIHHDFTYLGYRNIVHLEKLTLEKIVELYDHYKDVTYHKHDKLHDTEITKQKSYFVRLKEWWEKLSYIKCDYCGTKVKYCYDAYNTPIFDSPDIEYKGNEICIDCIKNKLPQDNITYIKQN